MKKILLIGTGGTIAAEVTESGLAPELTSEERRPGFPPSPPSAMWTASRS